MWLFIINFLLSGIAPEQSVFSRLNTDLSQSVSDTSFIDAATQATAAVKGDSLGPAFNLTLSDEATHFLLQLAQQDGATPPSPDDIFAQLDTNGDGTLSDAEFIEGRPDFASEAQAAAKFAQLDTDQNGTLTQTEAAEASQNAPAGIAAPPPPPPPPPAPSGGSSPLSELFDELDTDESGVVELDELMAGLEELAEEAAQDGEEALEVGASTDEAEQSLTAAFLQQLNQAIQSYLSAGEEQAEPQLQTSA